MNSEGNPVWIVACVGFLCWMSLESIARHLKTITELLRQQRRERLYGRDKEEVR